MTTLIRRIFLFFICINLLGQSQILVQADDHDRYKILIISSYDPDFPTAEDMMDGVKSVFSQTGVELDFEYMDTKELHTDEDLERLADYFYYKLSRKSDYDLVLVFDDKALHFAETYQEELFSGIPIVFAGVNDREYGLKVSENPLITGVMEDISIEETIDVIETLQPYVVNLYLVVDNTISGQADLQRFEGIESQMDIEVINMSELSEEAFIQAIKDIKPEDAILPLSIYVGQNGRAYPFKESSSILIENAQAPIYHLWKFGVGSGYVGGMVSSHFNQADLASRIGLSILEGENPANIQLVTQSPNQYLFDYEVMIAHGLDPNRLPQEATLLNKPLPLKESDPGLYWRIVLLLSVFTMIIFILFLIIQYRIRKTRNTYKMNLFMKNILDAVQIPISIRDDKKEYVMFNHKYTALLKHPPKQLIGKRLEDLYEGETLINLKKMDDRVLSEGQDERDIHISKNNNNYIFNVKKRAFKDGDGRTYILSSGEDITKLKQYENELEDLVQERTEALKAANAKLEEMAVIDQLTGIFNRRKLDEFLQAERDRYIRYSKVFSVILLDVDDFKKVNDTMGHAAGDDVLRDLSKLLKENIRKVDALGRWGGEEFMIICPETDTQAAKMLAEKLRGLIESSLDVGGLSITCSFGVVTVDQLQTPEYILNEADHALYDAKNNGRNQVKVANEFE